MEKTELVSIPQLAKELGYTREQLYTHCDRGNIVCKKYGKQLFVTWGTFQMLKSRLEKYGKYWVFKRIPGGRGKARKK